MYEKFILSATIGLRDQEMLNNAMLLIRITHRLCACLLLAKLVEIDRLVQNFHQNLIKNFPRLQKYEIFCICDEKLGFIRAYGKCMQVV
jgi:hypothetical protein